jgi:hypothetical protein
MDPIVIGLLYLLNTKLYRPTSELLSSSICQATTSTTTAPTPNSEQRHRSRFFRATADTALRA